MTCTGFKKAFQRFTAAYAARYSKAPACLGMDRDALLAFLFKLGLATEKQRQRIRGLEQLAKIIKGVKLTDGVEPESSDRVAA